MRYVLTRGPSFTVQDGPLRGRTFRKGRAYTEIPEDMADRFETHAPVNDAFEHYGKEPDPPEPIQTWTGLPDDDPEATDDDDNDEE